MQLHHAPASPFVRKVMVLAIEADLADRIEVRSLAVSPVSPNSDLNLANPIGKIPCLITDDGDPLFDSRVICEYLDSLHQGAPFFPAAGAARWTALRHQAIGDGIADAAVACRYETFLRPEAMRWQAWVDGQKQKVARGLDALEREMPIAAGLETIGAIAIACALGYLDFRFADDRWRDGRPALAAWYETISARPSMQKTESA